MPYVTRALPVNIAEKEYHQCAKHDVVVIALPEEPAVATNARPK